jgi:hypothetical protein
MSSAASTPATAVTQSTEYRDTAKIGRNQATHVFYEYLEIENDERLGLKCKNA